MPTATSRPLLIPWAKNESGKPQKAGDRNLPRGLACNCRCPNCDDQLEHKHGSKLRPHFAHYRKQATQPCFESSIHLAYKYAFEGTEGQTLTLPTTAEPSAMGPEPWLPDPEIKVTSVEIETSITLPDGSRREPDVMLTAEDGRQVAVEIHVTNAKEPEYAKQMESIGILAVEHHAAVTSPDDEIPSAREILVTATWLWEPYSAQIREAMVTSRKRDNLLLAEKEIISMQRRVSRAASTARKDPKQAGKILTKVANEAESKARAMDDHQRLLMGALLERTKKGLQFTEGRIREPFRKLVNSIAPASNKPIRPITQDKSGTWLRRDTRDTLNQRAHQVARLGFHQSSKRATLFGAQAGPWKLYVDFDSTDVMRIWEVDCEPAVYAFPKTNPQERELLLASLSEKLEQAGIPNRRYFPDASYGPYGIYDEDINPFHHEPPTGDTLPAPSQPSRILDEERRQRQARQESPEMRQQKLQGKPYYTPTDDEQSADNEPEGSRRTSTSPKHYVNFMEIDFDEFIDE